VFPRLHGCRSSALATLGVGLGLLAGAASRGSGRAAHRQAVPDGRGAHLPRPRAAAAFGYLTTLCFSLCRWAAPCGCRPPTSSATSSRPRRGSPLTSSCGSPISTAQALALMAILNASDQRLVVFFLEGAAGRLPVFYGLVGPYESSSSGNWRIPSAPGGSHGGRQLHRPGNISASVILSLGWADGILVRAVALGSSTSRG